MLTDPPHVPDGVTGVYATYANLAVHVADAGNLSGWTTLSTGATINLLSTLNISQTIAATKVPTGVYNALRFNVTSAQVTFNGKNYTSFVVNSELFIPIRGGIQVNGSKPSATIIDISPIVMNIGSSSNPEFVIRSAATAYPVPSTQVSNQMEHEGYRFSLLGRAWWNHINQNATANLQVTAASLSNTSLGVTVKSTSQNTSIKLIIVSPLAFALKGEHNRAPAALFGSEVFVVEGNGTIVPLQQSTKTAANGEHHPSVDFLEGLRSSGYNMTAGATATFTYSGQINLGFMRQFMTQTVVSGQQYLVTVMGTDALASYVVVAS